MTRPGIGGGLPAHVDQLALFAAHADGLDAAFRRFHEANPRVYQMLRHFAIQAKQAGRRRFGAKMLFERVRWYTEVETQDEAGFKVNNSLTSRYARLLMARERCSPKCDGCGRSDCLANFFELRALQTPTDPDALRSHA